MHFFDDETRDWADPDYSDYSGGGAAAAPDRRRRDARLPLVAAGDAADAGLQPGHEGDRDLPRPDRAALLAVDDGRHPLAEGRARLAGASSPSYAPDGLEEQHPGGRAGRAASGCTPASSAATTAPSWSRRSRLFGADQVHALEFRAFLRDHALGPRRHHRLPRARPRSGTTRSCRTRCAAATVSRARRPTGEDIAGPGRPLPRRLRQRSRKLSGLDCSALAAPAADRRRPRRRRAGRAVRRKVEPGERRQDRAGHARR